MNRGEFKIQKIWFVVLPVFIIVSVTTFIGMNMFYEKEPVASASSEEKTKEDAENKKEEASPKEAKTEKTEDNVSELDVQKNQEQLEVTAFCDDGFYLSGVKCKKEETADRIARAVCPDGFSLENKKCISKSSIVAEKVCPVDMVYDETTGQCFVQKPEEAAGDEETSDPNKEEEQVGVSAELRCSEGFVLDGEGCRQQVSQSTEYYCPDDFSLDGQVCRRTVSAEIRYR